MKSKYRKRRTKKRRRSLQGGDNKQAKNYLKEIPIKIIRQLIELKFKKGKVPPMIYKDDFRKKFDNLYIKSFEKSKQLWEKLTPAQKKMISDASNKFDKMIRKDERRKQRGGVILRKDANRILLHQHPFPIVQKMSI